MTKYQPPVDVDFGAQLPQRTPGEELRTIQLVGGFLITGELHGAPFMVVPGATKDEALATLQSVVDALEAL